MARRSLYFNKFDSIWKLHVGPARHTFVPVITEAPRNRTVTVGHNVTLHCRFRSDSEAYVDWFKRRDDVITSPSPGQSQSADTDWNSFVMIQVRQ